MRSLNRRDFLKNSTLLGAGLYLSPLSINGNPLFKSLPDIYLDTNIQISPLFILDNCARLAIGSDFIQSNLKYCLTQDITYIVPGNVFKMGSVADFSKEEFVEALDKIKGTIKDLNFEKSRRLSLITGAIINYKIRNILSLSNEIDDKSQEKTIYEDSIIIKTYYNKGKEFENNDHDLINNLFQEMIPRTFIRFHTLRPDTYNWPDINAGVEWVIKISQWRERIDQYIRHLSDTISNPEPGKVKKHIKEPNFFNDTDALLVKISEHAKVSWIDRDESKEMIENSKAESICSQAIGEGYQTLINISDFLSNQLNKTQLLNTL